MARVAGRNGVASTSSARSEPLAVAADRRGFLADVAWWERAGWLTMVAVAALLRLPGLDGEGFANTYYAATVKSMLTSWRNFFFASFDGGGFVAVDKPPLGFWVQTASAKLFGFSGPGLLLPQAIAGVLSVVVLAALVRKPFGPAAGLLAGLALAVAPVAVVVDRNNTPDALLILVMLGAVWAAGRAAASGSTRWLLLAMTLLGVGFNIKMLQAWLVLPAVVAVYLFTAPRSWWTRLGQLALSGFVLLVTSLAWSVAVDLTPAGQRPYVGSSGTNSALSLALGYNGLGRLAKAVGLELGTVRVFGLSLDLAEAPGFAPGLGDPGWDRLFRPMLAGQISWLLPVALAGLAAAAWQLLQRRPLAPLDRARGQALILWGGWLLVAALFFSTASFFHTYYLVTLAPPVAALTGIGIVALWREHLRGGWRSLLLPIVLVAAMTVQVGLIWVYPSWREWLTPLLVSLTLAAVAGLLLARRPPAIARAAAILGAAGLLVIPAVWSGYSVASGAGGAWLPLAGPFSLGGFGAGDREVFGAFAEPDAFNAAGESPGETLDPGEVTRGPGGGFPVGSFVLTVAGPNWNVLDPAMVRYLRDHQGANRFLAATETSTYAGVLMLATDEPVMALGGYQGWDEIVTPADLAAMTQRGEVRFFLFSPGGLGKQPGEAQGNVNDDLTAWVRAGCTVVPDSTWRMGSPPPTTPAIAPNGAASNPFGAGGPGFGASPSLTLYDCALLAKSGDSPVS